MKTDTTRHLKDRYYQTLKRQTLPDTTKTDILDTMKTDIPDTMKTDTMKTDIPDTMKTDTTRHYEDRHYQTL